MEIPNSKIEHLTNMLDKSCNIKQKQQQQRKPVLEEELRDKEIRFEPPWTNRIGQLQQVVRALNRYSEIHLDNRGSVIVRCYPYRSSTYMHLVYNLIYATLASNAQFGPLQAPSEIRPILLNYDENGLPNTVVQPAAPYGIPQFVQQPRWTDFVLVRIRFTNQETALCFLQAFNQTVGRVFDRRQVRAPFAHPDLTRPERLLRINLQKFCVEKNGQMLSTKPPMKDLRNRNVQSNNYQYRQLCQNGERYFHNGIQIYKEYPNGNTEPIPWEPYTELQFLHVIVASLRKYAPIYKNKECCVVIQNIDENDQDNDIDLERITSVVYSVVSTKKFRQRCQELQDHMPGQVPVQRSQAALLPTRIERIPRRTSKQQRNGKEGGGKVEPTGNPAESAEQHQTRKRAPLVRVQFRAKEAAIAFCQLFKECQRHIEIKSSGRTSRHDDDSDSYSDLSEMEVLSDEQPDNDNPNQKTKGKLQKENFPYSFAHRDLTPPELALGYAIRQFCRERNRSSTGLAASANANTGASSSKTPTNPTHQSNRFYCRGGRIFERSK